MEPKALKSAQFYAGLSIGAAVTTIGLKFWAYQLTGSVGLLSDALESLVNLAAALAALGALTLASKPPDEGHAFGYTKAEYFSSALEGLLILAAAASIVVVAVPRLMAPQPVEQVGWGLAISMVAALVNGVTAFLLLRAGRRLRSIALEADAHHLLTDVWTSIGVLIGLVAVNLTGWLILDPLIAIAVALNIIWAGFRLLRATGSGLLDGALPNTERKIIDQILEEHLANGIQFHALRTRLAGSRRFVTMHVLVPGDWTVRQGHDLCDHIELAISKALPGTHTITHLEPAEDPISWADQGLDR